METIAASSTPTPIRKQSKRRFDIFTSRKGADLDREKEASKRKVDSREESLEFVAVSLTGQTWHFEASMAEERELWVQSVQAQILGSLQGCRSAKDKTQLGSRNAALALEAVCTVRGNSFYTDCDAPSPHWAGLNLGVLCASSAGGPTGIWGLAPST
ncbi:Arf-GAP with GTPase; ANK repeat and PH domain-containing protein 3 [Camelus dromedarius]|uniref:Arf-GAP with GTPase n=1 Tax=Camelus dromedarius TaxID=9838 RepID=A0A5N4CII8_CAMDR|nr:Arf-GAP with GTPase; ANK repeat and PH domain-containing protein 3 [Camelus dromedarius]